MSIAEDIEDAIDDLNRGRPGQALGHVLIAVDATALKEGREGNTKKRMLGFLKSNRSFTCAFLGISGRSICLKPSVKADARTVDNILYELVRKFRIHEARLPDQVVVQDGFGVTEEGKFVLSPDLIWGLIYAVIASPANINERTSPDKVFQVWEDHVSLNSLWGHKEAALKLAMIDCHGRIPQKGRRPHA